MYVLAKMAYFVTFRLCSLVSRHISSSTAQIRHLLTLRAFINFAYLLTCKETIRTIRH